jgi:deoxyribonuclease-4
MGHSVSGALFGPGGNGDAFLVAGLKSTLEAPAFVKRFGLDAYEFEAGRGLRMPEDSLREIGIRAALEGVHTSFHAPYFISLSSVEAEKRRNSVRYIEESVWAARLLGARTVVVHTGSAGKITRREAMGLCRETLELLLDEVDLSGVSVGLETMGKKNLLGTLDEVLELCKLSPSFAPVVDFGHLNAREEGGVFRSEDDYRAVFDRIGTELGDSYAQNLHCHFSMIEWTHGGEKRHVTFAESEWGPPYEPLMAAIAKEGLSPVIICESAGTQVEDALAMKQYYQSI